MIADGGAHPVRNRPTLVTYAQVGVYGWTLYAFGASVALMRDERAMSSGTAALYGTVFSVACILVSLAGPRAAARLGRGRALRLGSATVAAGLIIYTSSLPLPFTFFGAFVLGLGGGLVVIFTNSQLNSHQGAAAPAALAEANMFAAIGGIIAPLVLGLGVALGWGWRPGVVAAAVGYAVIELSRGPRAPYDDHLDAPAPVTGRVRMPAAYWWACAAVALLVGAEFSLMLWSSDLLRARTGAGPGLAAVSVTAIVAGMAVGRGLGSVAARRISAEALLIGAIGLSIAGALLAWLMTTTATAFLFLFITGCGLALQWPLGIARIVRASGHHPDRAVSYATAVAGAATALLPFALASVSDRIGLSTAFVLIPVMLLGALVLVLAHRVERPDVPGGDEVDTVDEVEPVTSPLAL